MSYAGLGALGQSSDAGLEERLRSSADAAAEYVRDQWGRFVNLYQTIIDLQHRAAVVAYQAGQAGDLETEELARQAIHSLADLQRKHDATVRTAEGLADTIGLSGYGAPSGRVGLGAIPFAAAAGVSALALAVLWFFRAASLEERKLELLESGVATADELALLDPGNPPAMILGQAAGLAKVLLAGLALYVGWQILQESGALKALGKRASSRRSSRSSRARRNPPLVVFDSNPPGGLIGEEVLAVWYEHADDGQPYVHEFGPGVELYAEPDGRVTLEHRAGRELWQDFELEELEA